MAGINVIQRLPFRHQRCQQRLHLQQVFRLYAEPAVSGFHKLCMGRICPVGGIVGMVALTILFPAAACTNVWRPLQYPAMHGFVHPAYRGASPVRTGLAPQPIAAFPLTWLTQIVPQTGKALCTIVAPLSRKVLYKHTIPAHLPRDRADTASQLLCDLCKRFITVQTLFYDRSFS